MGYIQKQKRQEQEKKIHKLKIIEIIIVASIIIIPLGSIVGYKIWYNSKYKFDYEEVDVDPNDDPTMGGLIVDTDELIDNIYNTQEDNKQQ